MPHLKQKGKKYKEMVSLHSINTIQPLNLHRTFLRGKLIPAKVNNLLWYS